MALVLTAPPATEPLTVAEAKAHLRIGHAEEDAMVASLITTSRLHVEAALGLALIDQDWSYTLDSWPDGHVLLLPLRPVRAVTGVRVTTSDGSIDTLPADRYLLDGAALPPRLHAMGGAWPRPGRRALGIEVAEETVYRALLSRPATAAVALAESLQLSEPDVAKALARLEECGLVFSGMSPDGVLPETVEYADHPWFIGVQYHPELKSRPLEPHPLFASFIEAAVEQSRLV